MGKVGGGWGAAGGTDRELGVGVGVGFYYIISMGNSVAVFSGYHSTEMVKILQVTQLI